MSSAPLPSALLIFAKAPEPGKIKTRLIPPLSGAEAARLQEAMTLDILDMTSGLQVDRFLMASPDAKHPFFKRMESEFSLHCHDQKGGDLGERMENAFQFLFDRDFRKVGIIGTDSPTLPLGFLEEAFRRLERDPVVLGPSLDGGYYFIGLTEKVPGLFDGIRWGSDQVLGETLERIHRKKIGCALLPFWYDLDREADLVFADRHLELLRSKGEPFPERTFQVIRSVRPALTAFSTGRARESG